jgi:hypothetical protein
MPALHTDRAPTDISTLPQISDDECVLRLAQVVETHDRVHDDDDHLDEAALLIGRLAVPIEI